MKADEDGAALGTPQHAHEAKKISKEAALSALRRAHDTKKTAKQQVMQAVVDARHVGAQWRRVAEELGIAQPNAVRKFKRHVDELPAVNRWEKEADPQGPALVAVRHARRKEVDADAAEVQAVADARNAGATWDDIAEVLGMQQPNAVAKYRPLLVEERTVRVRAADE